MYDRSIWLFFPRLCSRDQHRRRIHISKTNDDQNSSSLHFFLLKYVVEFWRFCWSWILYLFQSSFNSLLDFKILDTQVLLNISDSIVLLNTKFVTSILFCCCLFFQGFSSKVFLVKTQDFFLKTQGVILICNLTKLLYKLFK